MSAKVICVASPKGGSGKTMLVASFATILSDIGKKVLMIDFDAATNGLSLFYLQKISSKEDRRTSFGLYDSCRDDEVRLNYININDNLDLLPATYRFNIEEKDINNEKIIEKMDIIRKEVIKSYDYIILDAQAGSDNFAELAMSRGLSDQIIIVSEYDPISSAGVERLKRLFPEDLKHERTWILLNKLLPDYVKTFSEFLEIARYLPPIPWEADVVRAYSKRKLAINTEKGNRFTLSLIRTLRGLLGDEIEDNLNEWLQDKAIAIRQPIEQQYNDLKIKIQAINRHYEKYKFRLVSYKILKNSLLYIGMGCMFGVMLFIVFSLPDDVVKPIIESVLGNKILLIITSFAVLFISIAVTKALNIYDERDKNEDVDYELKKYVNELEKLQELLNLNNEELIDTER